MKAHNDAAVVAADAKVADAEKNQGEMEGVCSERAVVFGTAVCVYLLWLSIMRLLCLAKFLTLQGSMRFAFFRLPHIHLCHACPFLSLVALSVRDALLAKAELLAAAGAKGTRIMDLKR